MGLFDNIIKQASKIVTNAIEDKVFDNVANSVKNTINVDNRTNTTLQNYTIPEKYSSFPKYEGNMLEKPVERETNNYSRITIRYSGTPSSEFISSLMQNGFIKGSSVRYDKGNTYVIVDNLGNKTEIVYHIKKY